MSRYNNKIINEWKAGLTLDPYVQVMPPFLSVIRTCDRGMREYLFKQLGQIISIIKQHARNYMPEIFSIIRVRTCTCTCMCNYYYSIDTCICTY
jgi:hypothetical protein